MKKTQKGFTLAETLVALAVAGILSILLVTVLFQNNSTFYSQSSHIEQGLGLNEGVSTINTALRAASAVAASVTSGGNTYTSDEDTLVLAIPSIDSNGNIIDQTSDYLVITADSVFPTHLKKILIPNALSVRPAEDKIITKNLSEIEFIYKDKTDEIITPTGADKVYFSIKTQEKVGISDAENSVSSYVNLRNF